MTRAGLERRLSLAEQRAASVRGRNSDNRLIEEKPGWRPSRSLREGLVKTYEWIEWQVHRNAA